MKLYWSTDISNTERWDEVLRRWNIQERHSIFVHGMYIKFWLKDLW